MKTYLDCIPCFFEQTLRAGRMATDDENKLKEMLDRLGDYLPQISLSSTPPEVGRWLYRMVADVSGNADPYREVKKQSTEQALALYPRLHEQVTAAADPLLMAVKVAIAGNVIDFGPNGSVDIEAEVNQVLAQEFAVCDYTAFRHALDNASRVLYIGDNAGETVFDRILIEQLRRPVTYVVRETPILNDATREDAIAAGLDQVAEIISSGTDAPGTILSTCSPEFRELLEQAEFVIAKGQGNYEGLSGEQRRIFFLLRAKCRLIASNLNTALGDIILKGINL